MILAYEFEYVSKNLVLENFLKIISEEFKVRHTICKDKNITTLYIEESEDRQHKFADFLSSNLPISIFLKSSNVKIVKNIKSEEMSLEKSTASLPFTNKAIEQTKDKNSFYFNAPFVPNEVGLTKISKNISLIFEDKKGCIVANSSDTYMEIYKTIANIIKNGDKVQIKTSNGNFIFFAVQKENMVGIKDFEIIPTDLSFMQKMVNIKENELQVLATLEKPIIRAKVNMVYESLDILPSNRIKIRMANTLLIQFICEELYKIGVEFIARSSQKLKYSCMLSYDINLPKIPDIEISVLENDEIFILNTDAYSVDLSNKSLKELKEPCIRQFASILKERNLFDDKTSCFYFSKKFNDSILYHDEEKGMLSLVKFPSLSCVKDIFDVIKKEDEIGKKLIENYEKTYPKIFRSAQRAKIPKKLSSNIFNMINFLSLIAGFSNDFKRAGEKLIEKAEDFGGQKGVRTDFRLMDEEKIYSNFNPYKLIKSVMSFKLAGTNDMTLSFGILESFAYFISDIADIHKETLGSSKIALGGSLFGYPLFAELVAKNLMPNHKIYFNQGLPIDNL